MGPLFLTSDQVQSDTDRRTGAAGRVVDCRTRIIGDLDDPAQLHPGAPASSPRRALRVGLGEGKFHGIQGEFTLDREEDERALFTYRVDGSVKQAIVVHHGPTLDRGGKVGWYVEGWARCDYAEFPDGMRVMGGTELQIWTNATGERQPTYEIVSSAGPAHCDWTSMTFLNLADDAVYVRDPQPDLQEEYFDEPFRTGVPLPQDAVASGFERDGRRLWISADRGRAYVGQPDEVEVWPRTAQPLLCA